MEKLKKMIVESVGYEGKMLSGSKSGYHRAHPNNLAVFNANVCIVEKTLFSAKGKKVWWGDMDITESRDKLRLIALELDVDIYVLSEMDGRFENEENPIIKNFIYRANGNGTEEMGNFWKDIYAINAETNKLERTKE